MTAPDCPHYTREPGNARHGRCSAGWFASRGGKVFLGWCRRVCIPKGLNSEQAYQDALYERTHPPEHRGVSGCCDDMRNVF
jgi:hypothetical protein